MSMVRLISCIYFSKERIADIVQSVAPALAPYKAVIEKLGDKDNVYAITTELPIEHVLMFPNDAENCYLINRIPFYVPAVDIFSCTERERKIMQHYVTNIEKLHKTYALERQLMKAAKEFITAFDNTVLIREAFTVENGTADLLFCYRGRFIAAELKAEHGNPSTLQLAFIEKVKRAGGSAGVCTCIHDIWQLMSEAL